MSASAEASPVVVGPVIVGPAVEARSLGQITWERLRRDKVAMGGGVFIVFLILVATVGPHLVENPDTYHPSLINPTFSRPNGPFGGISLAHPLGVEPLTGRDILSRIVNGAQYSMLIAFAATVLTVVIGVVSGVTAGYFGGWVDSIIARSMDVFLAFPLLLFALALVGAVPAQARFLFVVLEGNSLRICLLIFVIGFFNWPYMGRIVRGQTLSLREREFVDAARNAGREARTYCSMSCSPTWSGRSWCTPRYCCPRTSCSRPGCPTSVWVSTRRLQPGAACCQMP